MKNNKMTMTKLADKIAGTEGKPWSKRTKAEKRATWNAQDSLRDPKTGKYCSLSERGIRKLAESIDELNYLRGIAKTSKMMKELISDGEMHEGVPKSGW